MIIIIYKEEKRDLFELPTDYCLAHCVSHDFEMGRGIAKQFADYGLKTKLLAIRDFCLSEDGFDDDEICNWSGIGYSVQTRYMIKEKKHIKQTVFNLVTKERFFHKPTYKTLRESLEDMKEQIEDSNEYYESDEIKKIAMPRIGCGLDRLEWDKVSQIIQEVFADTDLEILICIK